MNSSYFNMISSAFLGTVFVVLTISFLSEALYHSDVPEQEGFVIEVAEGSAAPAGGAATEEVIPDIGPLLASADIGAGEKVFKKCAACHTIEDGGANKVGPGLWDIVGHAVGAKDGFGYSAAMTEYAAGGTNWDYENLNKFFLKPKAYIKGTAMGFAGLKKEKDRANLIAYMRTFSASPVALPE
ncbi:MAG: cytochrome c family protein [Lentilitoribacter sp.]